jgi:hypothetical protein
MPLKVLHFFFVLLGRFKRFECAQVAALACSGLFLA